MQPPHTHSRPYEDTPARSLGKLPNGERFGQREYHHTLFSFITASAITSDLPDIGNGNMQVCILHPDHCTSCAPTRDIEAQIRCIPKSPPGCGYKEAYSIGWIPPSLEKPGKEMGKAYQRVKEAGLIPTNRTRLKPNDAHNGASLPWS
jgi:DNA (cytosine-5)-methyltransferase 1